MHVNECQSGEIILSSKPRFGGETPSLFLALCGVAVHPDLRQVDDMESQSAVAAD